MTEYYDSDYVPSVRLPDEDRFRARPLDIPDEEFFRQAAAARARLQPGSGRTLGRMFSDAVSPIGRAVGMAFGFGDDQAPEPAGPPSSQIERDPGVERAAQQQFARTLSREPVADTTFPSLEESLSRTAPEQPPSPEVVAGPRADQIASAVPKQPKSFIRYKDASGNWKSYAEDDKLTGNRPNAMLGQASAFDPGTNSTVKYQPTLGDPSGATVSTAHMESLPLGQRPESFFEDDELHARLLENEARKSMAGLLAQDPLARQRAQAEFDIGKAIAIANEQSQLRRAEEGGRVGAYRTESGALDSWRDQQLAAAESLPPGKREEAIAKIEATYEERLRRTQEAHRLGTRLSGRLGED